VPHLAIDAPGGGGKVPVLPNYVDLVTEAAVQVRNYAGETFTYPLPAPQPALPRQ
jgi:lysine 2,3-aminomutase